MNREPKSISSDKDNIVQTAQNNLKIIFKINNINQVELCDAITNNTGYKISQSSLSKIINSQVGPVSIFNMLLICQELGINFNDICWRKLTEAEAYNYKNNVRKFYPIIDETVSLEDVAPYLGDYHCYFYPTLSDEAKRGDMHYASLNISYDIHNEICKATFIMHPNAIGSAPQKMQKRYNGRFIIVNKIHSCYIVLKNEENDELSILNFRKFTMSTQSMDCCIAGVLTVCAGQGRSATAQRMIISQRELSPKGIEKIRPHLLLNSKEIYLPKAKLDEFLNSSQITDKTRKILSSCIEEEYYCCIREEHLWTCEEEKNDLIEKLRNISISRKYHKIGFKADELLHGILYRDEKNDELFLPEKQK